MRSVLEAPEDLSSLKHFVGAHFVRQAATEPARPRDDYTTTTRAASDDVDIEIDDPFDRMNEVCIPTNPGTILHEESLCSPCAFVFRIAGGQVRNRCKDGDACGFCHHPSHKRGRGRPRGRKQKFKHELNSREEAARLRRALAVLHRLPREPIATAWEDKSPASRLRESLLNESLEQNL